MVVATTQGYNGLYKLEMRNVSFLKQNIIDFVDF